MMCREVKVLFQYLPSLFVRAVHWKVKSSYVPCARETEAQKINSD